LDVADLIIGDYENHQHTADEVLASMITALPDEKLPGFALRLVLNAYTAIPRDGAVDYLAEAEAAFALEHSNRTSKSRKRETATALKNSPRKNGAKMKVAG
jgi:ParB family chromosome partitioning protein